MMPITRKEGLDCVRKALAALLFLTNLVRGGAAATVPAPNAVVVTGDDMSIAVQKIAGAEEQRTLNPALMFY